MLHTPFPHTLTHQPLSKSAHGFMQIATDQRAPGPHFPHTLLHSLPRSPSDRTSSKNDFVFYTNRICRIVVEAGLGQLPFKEKVVVTPAGVGERVRGGGGGVEAGGSFSAKEQVVVTPAGVGKGVGMGVGKGAGKGEGMGQLFCKEKVVVTPAGVGKGVERARGRIWMHNGVLG